MTDGQIATQATRIFRYCVKIARLPGTTYTQALKDGHEKLHKEKIEEAIQRIESSGHAYAAKIGCVIRGEIEKGRTTSIATSIRPHLNLPRNWRVIEHVLAHVVD